MKPHTRKYLDYFGFQIQEDCFCELCGAPAVDINHIQARGMGGNPKGDKDAIENLMAMCRADHIAYGDSPAHKQWLKEKHLNFMAKNKR